MGAGIRVPADEGGTGRAVEEGMDEDAAAAEADEESKARRLDTSSSSSVAEC